MPTLTKLFKPPPVHELNYDLLTVLNTCMLCVLCVAMMPEWFCTLLIYCFYVCCLALISTNEIHAALTAVFSGCSSGYIYNYVHNNLYFLQVTRSPHYSETGYNKLGLSIARSIEGLAHGTTYIGQKGGTISIRATVTWRWWY